MKNRYSGNPSKEAAIAKVRTSRLESEYKANNAFVKAEQAKLKAMTGKPAKLEAEDLHFNAKMSNTGENAQKLGRALTKGLDDAFPVK